MRLETSWEGAITLEERVYFLVTTGQTAGLEFQALLKVYGREKLGELYQREKAKRTAQDKRE